MATVAILSQSSICLELQSLDDLDLHCTFDGDSLTVAVDVGNIPNRTDDGAADGVRYAAEIHATIMAHVYSSCDDSDHRDVCDYDHVVVSHVDIRDRRAHELDALTDDDFSDIETELDLLIRANRHFRRELMTSFAERNGLRMDDLC